MKAILITFIIFVFLHESFNLYCDTFKKNRDVPYKVVGDEQPGIGGRKQKPDTAIVWMESKDSICISNLHENKIINIKK